MIRYIKPILFVVCCLTSMVACKKTIVESPKKDEVQIVICTNSAETKTYIENTDEGIYSAAWHKGDKLDVFADGLVSQLENVYADGPLAKFSGSGIIPETGTMRAVYPFGITTLEEDSAIFSLKDIQHPSATSFDPEADVLLSKAYSYQVQDGSVIIEDLRFHRPVSVVKINLIGEDLSGERVNTFKWTSSATLTGDCMWNLNDNEKTGIQNPKNTITAIPCEPVYIGSSKNNAIYLIVPENEIGKNQLFTFEIHTFSYTITKSFYTPSAVKFPASEIVVFNLSLTNDDAKQNVSGLKQAIYSKEIEQCDDGIFALKQNIKGVMTHPDGYDIPFDRDYYIRVNLSGASEKAVEYKSYLKLETTPSLLPDGADRTSDIKDGKFTTRTTTNHYKVHWSVDGSVEYCYFSFEEGYYRDPEGETYFSVNLPYMEINSLSVDHVSCVKDEMRSTDEKTVYRVTCYYRLEIGYPDEFYSFFGISRSVPETYLIPYTHYRSYIN